MSYDSKKHRRKSIRLKGYDYSQPGLYFVTICCKDMLYRFGNVVSGKMELNEYGEIAYNEWSKLPERFPNFELDVFQIMPNHMLGIVELHDVSIVEISQGLNHAHIMKGPNAVLPIIVKFVVPVETPLAGVFMNCPNAVLPIIVKFVESVETHLSYVSVDDEIGEINLKADDIIMQILNEKETDGIKDQDAIQNLKLPNKNGPETSPDRATLRGNYGSL